MIQVGMITHSSVTDLLKIPINLFFDIFVATAEVLRKKKVQEGR